MDKLFPDDIFDMKGNIFESKNLEEGELSDDIDDYFIKSEPVDDFLELYQTNFNEFACSSEENTDNAESEKSDDELIFKDTTKILKGNIRRNRNVDKNLKELEYLLPDDFEERIQRIKIKDNEPLAECGIFIHRIEDTQTITFRDTRGGYVMDIGTAVFDGNRTNIGIIGYIFGKADDLHYQVFCKDEATIAGFHSGDKLFCAPGASDIFFRAKEAQLNIVDNDGIDDDMFFSDDDKELEYNHSTRKPKLTNKRFSTGMKKPITTVPINKNPFIIKPLPKSVTLNQPKGYVVPPSKSGTRSQPKGYVVPPPSFHGWAPVRPYCLPWLVPFDPRVPPPAFSSAFTSAPFLNQIPFSWNYNR